MRYRPPLLLLLPLALAAGCSTIVHVNRPSGLSVKGSPSGASILVDGVHRGYTATPPVQIAVEGDSGAHVVRLEKKGYVPQEFTVDKSMSGWVWGNAPFAVFPLVAAAGVGIDATCGSWYRLDPGEIDATLSPALPPPAVEATKTEGQTPAESEGQTPAEGPAGEAEPEEQAPAEPEGQTPAEDPAGEAEPEGQTPAEPEEQTPAEPEGQTPAPALDENGLVPPPAAEDGLEEAPKPEAPQPAADDGLAPPPVGDFQFTP